MDMCTVLVWIVVPAVFYLIVIDVYEKTRPKPRWVKRNGKWMKE